MTSMRTMEYSNGHADLLGQYSYSLLHLVTLGLSTQSTTSLMMCCFFANRRKVRAVRVNPQVLMHGEKRPRYEAISLAQNDQIFEQNPASISEAFRIKIVCRPLKSNGDTSKLRLSVTDTDNEAQHLFRCCDANKADHSVVNQKDWDHEFGKYGPPMTGSILLARYDKQPFHVLHAMGMLKFAETVMSPELDLYQQERKSWQAEETHFEHQAIVMRRRIEIVGKARREFGPFWRKFKQQTVQGRPDLLPENARTLADYAESWLEDKDEFEPRPEWASVPSPYTVGKQTRSLDIW